MTISTIAKKYADMFQAIRNEQGEVLRYAFSDAALKNEDHEAISDVIRQLSDSMDTDSAYEFTVEALELFSDCETEEEAEDRISEIEADVYTSDLTAWLNRAPGNVGYITEALREYGAPSEEDGGGFALLARAQYMAKEEAAREVLACLLVAQANDTESES